MGDINQMAFLKRVPRNIEGPILEIGSKNYGSTENFRAMFPGIPYVGIDMAAGDGVDHVVDLTQPPPPEILAPASFGLIISCSVLEHVQKPWLMAEHMSSLLRKGGIMFISVPWVYRYHAYPDDYFRFSPNGIKVLFPDVIFDDMAYSTTVHNEFFDLNEKVDGVDNAHSIAKPLGNGVLRKYLPYLVVNMIGRKV